MRLKNLQTVVLASVLFLLPAAAQAQAPATPATPQMPSVPTTKILAIGSLVAPRDPALMRGILPKEVRQTVELYLNGKIDQWYYKQDGTGVVFLMNMSSVDEARQLLDNLPLGQAAMMHFDLIPLGPLNPLRALLY